jgi:hypothetical protein
MEHSAYRLHEIDDLTLPEIQTIIGGKESASDEDLQTNVDLGQASPLERIEAMMALRE